MLPAVLDLGPEKAACHGSDSEEGFMEEQGLRDGANHVLCAWAAFPPYPVPCRLTPPLCSAAVMKGVTPSSSSLHVRTRSLQQWGRCLSV